MRLPVLMMVMLFAQTTHAAAFDLQGHRGARGLMPENTLAAFARALTIGVTTLELDTGITSDGVVVITHNQALSPAITRRSNGRWLAADTPTIHALTQDELAQYDVGRIDGSSKMASRFPEQTPVDGARIPTLDAVLDLVEKSGNERVRLNIETKINPRKPGNSVDPETFVQALVGVIRARHFEARTSIQSFDWRTLQITQSIAPEIETAYLSARQEWLDNIGTKGPSPWTAGFDITSHANSVPAMVHAAGGKVWSPFHGDIDSGQIEAAHALGLKVIPWTVNKPAAMENLIEMGVDGAITDYPDRLRAVMADRNLALPQRTPVEP